MSFEVEKEPSNLGPAENCAFCRTPTRYWHTASDVAVCPNCAELHDASEIPLKHDWMMKERRLSPPRVYTVELYQ